MTLSLPSDLEPYTTDYTQAGIYALDVTMPDDLASEWDRRFENRAGWFDQLQAARNCVYVGASANLISRLEDHRDGQVRKAVLPSLATEIDLRNVWPKSDADDAFREESQVAIRLRNHLPADVFVRQA